MNSTVGYEVPPRKLGLTISKPLFLGTIPIAGTASCALLIGGVQVSLAAHRLTGPIMFAVGIGLYSLMVGMGLVLLATMWRAIQGGPARTTPAKAVGFLFIPLFNLYWIFQAVWGWARDFNRYITQKQCALSPVSESLPFALCVLGVLDSVLWKLGIPLPAGISIAVLQLVLGLAFLNSSIDAVNGLESRAAPRRAHFVVACAVVPLFTTVVSGVLAAVVTHEMWKRYERATYVASVNGEWVTVDDWRWHIQALSKHYERLLGEKYEGVKAQLEKSLPREALNELIRRTVILQDARRLGVSVSKEEVVDAIMHHPLLQRDGVFIGQPAYQELVRRGTLGPYRDVEDFESSVRDDLLMSKWGSAFYPEQDSNSETDKTKQAYQEYEKRVTDLIGQATIVLLQNVE